MEGIDSIVDIVFIKVKMNRVLIAFLSVVVCIITTYSCKQANDSAFHGTVTITSDESLQPMVEQLCQGYVGIHADTKFNVSYLPEHLAIAKVLEDSSRLAFVTRELTTSEQNVFKTRGIRYSPQFIAIDGLALLTSRANEDSLITLKEVEGIFKGQIKNWSQLEGSQQTKDINGRTFRVRGRGIERKDGSKGDLLVTVDVQVPSQLNDEAKEALRQFSEAVGMSNPRAKLFHG